MTRTPSDAFKEKLTLDKTNTPFKKLVDDDVNYLTETCLSPRKPFNAPICKTFFWTLAPKFIKTYCGSCCKSNHNQKLIVKGNKVVTDSLDIVNIVRLRY